MACYRIAHDGWENTKALSEAKTNGMSRIEIAMQHYVMRYQAPVRRHYLCGQRLPHSSNLSLLLSNFSGQAVHGLPLFFPPLLTG